jgi:plasmid stabilization system protein ParE
VVHFTFSPKFIAQLKEICHYLLENRSEEVAREFEEKVFKEIEKLEHSPQRWLRVEIPRVDGEFRRILVGVYQIFYEIEDDHIIIHAIVDGRRRPPLFHAE